MRKLKQRGITMSNVVLVGNAPIDKELGKEMIIAKDSLDLGKKLAEIKK